MHSVQLGVSMRRLKGIQKILISQVRIVAVMLWSAHCSIGRITLYLPARICAYPGLAKLSKAVLCVEATSVMSEQMFSAAGTMCVPRRNRLGKTLLETLMFLYCNVARRDV